MLKGDAASAGAPHGLYGGSGAASTGAGATRKPHSAGALKRLNVPLWSQKPGVRPLPPASSPGHACATSSPAALKLASS